jgi:hypothetical protein
MPKLFSISCQPEALRFTCLAKTNNRLPHKIGLGEGW